MDKKEKAELCKRLSRMTCLDITTCRNILIISEWCIESALMYINFNNKQR